MQEILLRARVAWVRIEIKLLRVLMRLGVNKTGIAQRYGARQFVSAIHNMRRFARQGTVREVEATFRLTTISDELVQAKLAWCFGPGDRASFKRLCAAMEAESKLRPLGQPMQRQDSI